MTLKSETQAAIRAMGIDSRQNLLRFIYSTMTASEFVGAFEHDDGSFTDDGNSIADAFEAEIPDAEPDNSEFELAAERLHEAICEGRRQDAVDILNEVTDLNFRTVAAQMNLFPDRITL